MNIHEYQSKSIMKDYGVKVPFSILVKDLEEAEQAAWKIETEKAVVKAQVHAGARGKAGGVKVVDSISDLKEAVGGMLGKKLINNQTGPEGKEINKVLIEEGLNIEKEYYLAVTINRETNSINLVGSIEGGMDIEEVASKSPEKIIKKNIDISIGYTDYIGKSLAYELEIDNELVGDFNHILKSLYTVFLEKDCELIEINPLVITKEKELIVLDCKMNFDDNSLYRNMDIFTLRDLSQENIKELEAKENDLSYISLEGNIGCMVNGAGLAMATMDTIKHFGGNPANFLDVGGSASEDKIKKAFDILISDKNVEGIFINIFGGIMRCDVIAKGFLSAIDEIDDLNIPIVIRLDGNNKDLAYKLIEESKIKVITADSIEEGGQKIIQMVKGEA